MLQATKLDFVLEKFDIMDYKEKILNRSSIDNGKLLSLNLSGFNIQEIPSDAFDNFTQLRELNLSRNCISSIPEDIFINIPNLKILTLSHNNISCISNLFTDIPDI